MANGPRIIFIAAADVVGREGISGRWHPVGDYDEQSRYGWRLIGANNRELGRSPVTYGGLAEARGMATAVRSRAIELSHTFTNNETDGSWIWLATLGAMTVAVSGRTYLRQRECHYNYQQFVAALGVAVESLSPTVRPRVRLRRLPPLPPRGARPDNGLPYEPAAP